MIDARCLHCSTQKPLVEFVAEGGKVDGPVRKALIVGVPHRWKEGKCWKCERERRALEMSDAR